MGADQQKISQPFGSGSVEYGMKTFENQTHYKCDHCNKLYLRKHACEAHEPKCRKNPKNHRPCFGCHFIENRIGTGIPDPPFSPQEISVTFCTLKDKLVCPPTVDSPYDVVEIYGYDYDTEMMPKTCEEARYVIPKSRASKG